MTYPAQVGSVTHYVIPEYLEKVLDTIVGVFEQAGVELPTRRYWTLGGVAADCAQLTVHLTQVYKGLPGADPNVLQRCESPRTAALVVQLFRSVPVGTGQRPPASDLIQREAFVPAVDTWLLLDAAEAVDALGWNTGVLAEVNIAEPAGGLIGLSLTLTVAIP